LRFVDEFEKPFPSHLPPDLARFHVKAKRLSKKLRLGPILFAGDLLRLLEERRGERNRDEFPRGYDRSLLLVV
jgi:hypothetical protein